MPFVGLVELSQAISWDEVFSIDGDVKTRSRIAVQPGWRAKSHFGHLISFFLDCASHENETDAGLDK